MREPFRLLKRSPTYEKTDRPKRVAIGSRGRVAKENLTEPTSLAHLGEGWLLALLIDRLNDAVDALD